MSILPANNYFGGIMIKGVNKRIVEVNDPDSLYFERAVFYLRPNVSVIPDTISHNEAERLYSQASPHRAICRRKMNVKRLLFFSAAAAVILLLIKIF